MIEAGVLPSNVLNGSPFSTLHLLELVELFIDQTPQSGASDGIELEFVKIVCEGYVKTNGFLGVKIHLATEYLI